VIGATPDPQTLLDKSGVEPDAGVLLGTDVEASLKAAAKGRVYDREPEVRTVY
jgi:catalase